MANISYKIPEGSEEFDKYRESLPGPAFGLGYASGGKIGFEIDVLYLTKGSRFKGEVEGVTFDVKGTISEISVPILLNVNILSSPLIYGLGGGEIAYVMSAKAKYFVSDGVTEESGEEDVKEDTSQIDYGLVFGGGVGMPLGPVTLFGELRYHLGLANMEKNTPEGVEEQTSPKTRMFLIVAGIRF